jgi:hypothetical protein
MGVFGIYMPYMEGIVFFAWTVFIICLLVAGHDPFVLLAYWFGGILVLLILSKSTKDVNANRINRRG